MAIEQFRPAGNPGADARRLMREVGIEIVRKLVIRGITRNAEIQAYFARQNPPVQITERTVSRYKSELKRRNARRLISKEDLSKTIEELAITLKEDYEEVTKELWVMYHDKGTPASSKVQALIQIRATSDSWVDKLQSLGFAHKEPDRHQIVGADGKPVDPTINVDIENLNASFISFIKAQHQDPVGHTGTHLDIERKADAATRVPPQAT